MPTVVAACLARTKRTMSRWNEFCITHERAVADEILAELELESRQWTEERRIRK